MIIVLFSILIAAAITQFSIASRDVAPLEGPLSPGQLPSPPASAAPAVTSIIR